MKDVQLTSEEERIIHKVLASFSRDAKSVLSLDYLLQKWRNLVLEVEQGYGLTIFDYTNDLGKRDYLQSLLRQVPESVEEKLLSLIQPLDSRFENATKEVEEAILPSTNKTVQLGPWWYRVPTRLHDPPYDFEHWAPYYT